MYNVIFPRIRQKDLIGLGAATRYEYVKESGEEMRRKEATALNTNLPKNVLLILDMIFYFHFIKLYMYV